MIHDTVLCRLETCFGSWVPPQLFPKAPDQQNSRDRDYTRGRAFWCMLWQVALTLAAGVAAVLEATTVIVLRAHHTMDVLAAARAAWCAAIAAGWL